MKQKSCDLIINKHFCEKCDYKTDKKSSFDKHLTTRKHLCNKESNFCNNKVVNSSNYVCLQCNINYNSRVSLWRHKKTCIGEKVNLDKNKIENLIFDNYPFENIVLDASSNEIKLLTNLVLEIVKSNTELQKQNHTLQQQMLEVCQKIQPNNITNNNSNNTNNSHNKTFNLNFFLNEQCKDAMNIMDFVETFHLQIADLEKVGEIGFVQGISNIIIDKLNKMDIYKRPIHCSDAKRETMHIKDKGVWEKDNENNDKLRLAVKHITHKNLCLIAQWRDNHPGVANSEHRLNDKYSGLIIEAMGGKNKNTMQENETKIIKKISKMVLIDKSL